ncbi:MAG: MFS transporter [Tagaea sp.]
MKSTFFGWRVVWAAFVVAVFGWGLGFYGPPILMKTVQDRHDWPTWLVSAAVTFHFLVGAAAVTRLPGLHKRFGIPRVTLGGAALLALGLIAWSQASSPPFLFVAAGLTGIGWIALGAAAINAMVSPWFERKRPAALSLAYNGASLGGVIFSPLLVASIAGVGLTATSLWIGVGMLAILAALCAKVLRYRPGDLGQLPDGDLPDAPARLGPALAPVEALRRDRAFLTLAAGMAFGLFAQIGLIAHLYSLLVPALGGQGAGFAAGMATACAIFGRTAMGWIMPPHADRRVLACANYAVQILGCFALVLADGSDTTLLLIGVALFGFGIGNTTSLPPLIAQKEFAKADVPRVVALAVACGQATYAFAPAIFGLARDFASDRAAILLAACVFAAAIALYLSGRGAFNAPTRGRA